MKFLIIPIAIACLATSCQTARSHQHDLPEEEADAFTLGRVQKKIHVGMSQTDVVYALGSPNIVTKDAHAKESWVYDKAAREVSYSQDGGGVWLIFGGYGKNAGASQSSQKTLTIVIKFGDTGLVEDVTYHATKF